MKPLFTKKQYIASKPSEKLPLECLQCHETFYAKRCLITAVYNGSSRNSLKYCCRKCSGLFKQKRKYVECKNCHKSFEKRMLEINRTKNNFCSKSCANTYNNLHKKYGIRRSKLEEHIELQLKELLPDIHILFNNKTIINSELDIYIPKLKLAFELNGIFHYEPIFGNKKLDQIQNNDQRKFQACLDLGIELCIIDVSSLKYFKKDKAEKYLNIIISIINQKLKVSI